ncbi:MAG: prolyl-tRNA synthetase associated domain-containing protein [Eubacterium sp.]|nr:prolyl-tRNA synthetase associated domain-containing protein [Eubacterium sp.]
MNKQEIYDFLTHRGIQYETTEHPAVYNMEELAQVDLPYPEADAKNLFVRDSKKKNYYLISVKGDKQVDLKAFRKRFETKPLSFASAEDLMALLKLIPGAVSPLGLLNDAEGIVYFFIDQDFIDAPGLIGVHPNDNTATVWLKTEDLIDLIKDHGNPVQVVSFE